ncbi:maturin [Ailuropoda melanoleuca]|uniref:maturin n=1 Tax=Ailuropoda melanoleuca TaxID=9646 RepID=UPI001494E0A8|nr:maturin [Ailuropoda melanoleuca]
MEAAVGSGYRVVAGRSLELALRPPLRTRWGGAEARPGAGSSGGGRQSRARGRAAARPCPPREVRRGHVWSESEDCLPFLQLAQDYISSCGKKTLHEVLEKVFKSFRPLLGLPDADDDAFEEYSADVEEEEPEADHPQMGVSQQ